MSYWFVYWVTRLDSLNDLLGNFTFIGLFFGLVAAGGAVAIHCCYRTSCVKLETHNIDDGEHKLYKPWLKPSKMLAGGLLCLGIVSCIFSTFLPTTKEAATIYLLPKISNSQTVEELTNISPNLAKLLNKKMNAWLEDVNIVKEVEE